jgi:hypothetical protein
VHHLRNSDGPMDRGFGKKKTDKVILLLRRKINSAGMVFRGLVPENVTAPSSRASFSVN